MEFDRFGLQAEAEKPGLSRFKENMSYDEKTAIESIGNH